MDVTKLSDAALAKLMIDCGDEAERRRAALNLQGTVSMAIKEATAAGIPAASVDSAIVEAKARAKGTPPAPAPATSSPAVATPTKGTK